MDAVDARLARIAERTAAPGAMLLEDAWAAVLGAMDAHQRDAIAFMEVHSAPGATHFRGGVLALVMGLGKTLLMVAWAWRAAVRGGSVLLALTTSGFAAVERELDRVGALTGRRLRAVRITSGPAPVLRGRVALVTHGLLAEAYARAHAFGAAAGAGGRVARNANDAAAAARPSDVALFAHEWSAVFVDEAHVLRNGGTTRAFYGVRALRAPVKWALTGTPGQKNAMADIAGMLTALAGRTVRPEDAAAVYAAVALRATQPAAAAANPRLALPPRTDRVLRVTLPPATRAAYERARAAGAHVVCEMLATSPAAARDVPGAAALLGEDDGALPEHKFDAIAPLVVPGTVVFSRWRRALAALLPRVPGRVALYHGGLAHAAKAALTARILAGDMDVLLCTRAGSESLDMTAFFRVVLLDSEWNPAVHAQSAARVHRRGQTRAVEVYTVVAADTVDEVAYHAAAARAAVAEAVAATAPEPQSIAESKQE
jgi:hypothetical protein